MKIRTLDPQRNNKTYPDNENGMMNHSKLVPYNLLKSNMLYMMISLGNLSASFHS